VVIFSVFSFKESKSLPIVLSFIVATYFSHLAKAFSTCDT
jgi:hypothetical protein